MREIKFRAWDKKERIMGFVTRLVFNKNTHSFCNARFYKNNKIKDDGFYFGQEDGSDNIVLMQYIGLKDKNGREIYEGDLCTDKDNIVQIVWSENHQWGCKIVKTNYILQKYLTFPLWQWDRCEKNGNRDLEVIGNIYENPELLEVKQ